MAKSIRCFLRSLFNSQCISLPDGAEIVIGRSPTTQVSDKRCSKQQLSCVADLSSGKVHVEVVGANSSGINGEVINKGETRNVCNGDLVELLHGQHMFMVVFEKDVALHSTPTKNSLSDIPVKKKMRYSEDISLSSSKEIINDCDKWETINNGKLLIFTSKGVTHSSKIAGFDMDNTVICTKSGKVFPTNDDDWKILWPQIIPKMKTLQNDGFKIVIFTNQAGIEGGKVPIPSIKRKLELVVKALGVPAQAFVSGGKGGIYRKPCPGMWDTLVKENNGNIAIDPSKTFYCGDAAGRIDKWAPKKKKDFSCSDRLFALNLKVNFLTPEEFFLGEKPARYELPAFQPIEKSVTNMYQPNTQIPSPSSEVIVMVGSPGSGKSHYCRTYLLSSGYTHVNRDVLGSWQKCVNVASAALSKGQRVVIDNTNPDVESRARFVEMAKKASVPCRCFVMSVSEVRARHNNKFRELMKEDHPIVSDILVRMYKSKYSEPQLSEGFSEIIHVNFIPKFEQAEAQRLYSMYLLDKY